MLKLLCLDQSHASENIQWVINEYMYHCMRYIFDTFDISQQFEMVKLSTNVDLNAVVTLTWAPFLKRPGNLTGLKSYFEIKVSRKVGRVLTSNEVNLVSLADTFTVQFSNLLKLPSGMENKTSYYYRELQDTSP